MTKSTYAIIRILKYICERGLYSNVKARLLWIVTLTFLIVQSTLLVAPLQSTHAATSSNYGYDDSHVPAKYKQAYHDYVDYDEQLEPLQEYEQIGLTIFKENKKFKASDHRPSYVEITGIALPNYKKFVKGVQKVYTPNKDLARMHKIYVKGANYQLQGMLLFQKYLSTKKLDPSVLKKANTQLAIANKVLTQFHKEMDTYTAKFSY